MAVLLCLVIFFLYQTGGAQIFSAFRTSEMEKKYVEEEWVTLDGVIENKIYKKEELRLLVKEQLSGEKIYVSLADGNNSETFKIGQKIQVTGNAAFFQKSPNPGNFNQKAYYQKQNITMSLQEAEVRVKTFQERISLMDSLREHLSALRYQMRQRVIFYMGEDYGGIFCAMLLGDDAYLNETWKELLQKSGIGHLLAISSLHVSLIGMSIYKGMRKLGIPIRFSAISGSLILCSYVIMTGGSISAWRSCLMFVIRMGAYVLGREYDGLAALSVAEIVLLLRQPVLLFDAGFLLSFGAVLGIYLVAPVLELPVGIAISVVIFPIQLYFYYEYCFYSLFWNLLAIPMATVVIGSGGAGLIIAFMGSFSGIITGTFTGVFVRRFPELLCKAAFGLARIGLAFYCRGSEIVLNLPYARGVSGRPGVWWIVGYYAVLLLALLVNGRRSVREQKPVNKGRLTLVRIHWYIWQFLNGRHRYGVRVSLEICIFLLAAGMYVSPHGQKDKVEIVMLNVGQGDSFFIRGPSGGTYLIDGGSSSVKNVGKYRIEPFLKMQGVGTLDYVWVSHGDEDHLNGIAELLERKMVGISVTHLVLPAKIYWNESLEELAILAQSKGTEVLTMTQGELLAEGQMQMKCLWSVRDEEKILSEASLDENQSSTVLSLEYGDFAMLFTGDLEKEAEETVASYIEGKQVEGELPKNYEILKVGHHGSKNGTGEHLLEVVNPACAWISAGERNRYGHPSQEVLERLAKRQVNLYNTKDGSAVKLCTDGKKYCILRP